MGRAENLHNTLRGNTREERRSAILQELRQRIEGDLFCVFGITETPDGLVYDDAIAEGIGQAAWRDGSGRPFVSLWDPYRPEEGVAGRFVPNDTYSPRQDARFYAPFGLANDLRMLVYDGDRFAGWVGVAREGARGSVNRTGLRQLNAVRERFANLVIAESRLARPMGVGRDAHLTLTETGRLESVSRAAEPLITRALRARLADLVRRLDRDSPATLVAEGLLIRSVRLDGPGGVRILCTLQGATVASSPLILLTPAQREVAEAAAAGATVAETARHLGITQNTARTHLKAVYARLGVASRLELAERLVVATPASPC